MSVLLKKNQAELSFQDRRKFKPQNFIHTSLFSEVYVFNDIPMQFKPIWERTDDHGCFDQFFTGLISLMESFSPADANKWNHSETLNELVFPMLEILGYGDAKSKNNSILENGAVSIMNEDGSQIDLKPSLLFCEDEAGKNYIKNSSKNNSKSELKKYLKLPIQTSYYGSSFDRKSNKYDFKKDEIGKRGDVLTNLGPDDQMAEYLKIFNVNWGIYTDGAIWRLYRKEASASYSQKFYEFDFSELYNLYRTSGEGQAEEHSEFFEIAKYMFWFFSFDGLIKGPTVIPFIESVYQKSQVYIENIEEDLKERFVHAMTISCNGYLESVKGKGHEIDLKLIAKTSESLIFNLIFIRSCESKRVLPVHQDYVHISLKALVDKVRHFSYLNEYDSSARIVKQSLKDIFDKEIKDEGYDIYEYIQHLHSMVEEGNNGFGITGFVESVFYPEERSFYKKYKISNRDMIKLVYQLFYNFNNGKNVQIPYNLITPRQLGSVYESFLEFQPVQTSTKMFYVKRSAKGKSYWQWVEQDKVKKGEKFHLATVEKKGIIFSPNNEERKTTGSYYTPDTIVDYIVKETFGDLCKGKSVQEILKLKICDPAMGSGHFLLGALDFLAKKIAEKGESKNFVEIKRDVLELCIYGVDINPSAVKLGRMSLWLATALPGMKLEELSEQLKVGNSLDNKTFDWKKEFQAVYKNYGFDAFVGNPPYAKIQTLNNIDSNVLERYKKNYKTGSKGNFDLYVLFYERCHELLNKQGIIGFITPNTYLMSEFGAELRAFISEKKCLVKVVDFKQAQIFSGVSTYTCITFLSKRVNDSYSYSCLKNDSISLVELSVALNENEKSKLFEFSKLQSPTTSNKWSGATGSKAELLERLKEEHSPLKEYTTKIYQGVATSADDVFILDFLKEDKNFFYCYSKASNKEIKVEKDVSRIFYLGKDISRFSPKKKVRVAIYPYKKNTDGKYKLISSKEFATKYSLAFNYLKEHKKTLELREKGKFKGESFYQYSYPKSLEEFDYPKIMMRNFSLRSQITLDVEGGLCFTTNIYGINLKRSDSDFLYFILAVLNSQMMWFFIKNTSAGIRGGYYQYKTKYVEPFPVIDFDKMVNRDKEKVKALVFLSKKQIDMYEEETSKEIDKIIFELYKLSSAERSLVLSE